MKIIRMDERTLRPDKIDAFTDMKGEAKVHDRAPMIIDRGEGQIPDAIVCGFDDVG